MMWFWLRDALVATLKHHDIRAMPMSEVTGPEARLALVLLQFVEREPWKKQQLFKCLFNMYHWMLRVKRVLSDVFRAQIISFLVRLLPIERKALLDHFYSTVISQAKYPACNSGDPGIQDANNRLRTAKKPFRSLHRFLLLRICFKTQQKQETKMQISPTGLLCFSWTDNPAVFNLSVHQAGIALQIQQSDPG